MAAGVKEKRVSDMTVGELKEVIRETMREMMDPDHGLELRPEFEAELLESIEEAKRGEVIPFEEVKRNLGLA